jgi:UDP:flavonoid glycosyltransferase YjiC (YdhE family)
VLPTARALLRAGHGVVVATNRELHPVVEGEGLVARDAGISDEAMLDEQRSRWPESVERPPSEWVESPSATT